MDVYDIVYTVRKKKGKYQQILSVGSQITFTPKLNFSHGFFVTVISIVLS
jgi:hypothetical protein